MTICLGKSCSFGLPRVSFVNCRQFMYLVISLLVLRADCGIWLYQFLIIAYLLPWNVNTGNGSSWSLLGTLSQAMTAVGHYRERYHGQWQQLIITGNIITGNDSTWSPQGMLSRAMTAVDHYWERYHRQRQQLITTGYILLNIHKCLTRLFREEC